MNSLAEGHSDVNEEVRRNLNSHQELLYPDLEDRLRPLATPLGEPESGDWLSEHHEKGQTFRQYLAAKPVRRDTTLTTIYMCLVGEFSESQESVVNQTCYYLSLFFDVPVSIHQRVPLATIPSWARRKHPKSGDKQLLTNFILQDLLEPDRPNDALAYLALTTRDLWPGDGWNFVFGQANLRRRIGVWSIARNGYPGKSEEAYRLCLRRTLLIAAHETGHVLTLQHCTAFHCLMNGCNSQQERDRLPLAPCPVCLRKLCWNLQVEPVTYLRRLAVYCASQGLEDAKWYEEAAAALEG